MACAGSSSRQANDRSNLRTSGQTAADTVTAMYSTMNKSMVIADRKNSLSAANGESFQMEYWALRPDLESSQPATRSTGLMPQLENTFTLTRNMCERQPTARTTRKTIHPQGSSCCGGSN